MLNPKRLNIRPDPRQVNSDFIFFLLRGLFFAGAIAWALAIRSQIRLIPALAEYIPAQLFPLLLWFLLCSGLFYWLIRRFPESKTAAYYVMMALDTAFVTLLIYNTGQGNSNFYLGYYLFIAAYTLAFGAMCGALATVLSALCYLSLYLMHTGRYFAADFGARLSFMFIVFFVVAVMIEKEKRDKQLIAEDKEKINELNRRLERSFVDIIEEKESIAEKNREKTALLQRQSEITERGRSHIAFSKELNARKTIEEAVLLFSRYVGSLLDVDGVVLVVTDEESHTAEIYKSLDKVVSSEQVSIKHPVLEAARNAPDNKIFWNAEDDPGGRVIFNETLPPDAMSAVALPLIENRIDSTGVYILHKSSEIIVDDELFEEIGFLANHLGIDIQNLKYSFKLQELADTDGLTAVYNHRYFQQRLDQELQRSARYARPLSLVMFDIDHFKSLNDTHGHPAGDAVLRELSSLVLTSLRKIDVLARYGGEEFVVILPETGAEGAMTLAGRLRTAVEDYLFPIGDGKSVRITISGGVASYPEHADKTSIISAADKALYRAKQNGRNRIESQNNDDDTAVMSYNNQENTDREDTQDAESEETPSATMD